MVAGCSPGTVMVTPPTPSGQVIQDCDHLGNQLPAKLESLHSRVVSPSSPLTHAWGSPPITLRCGVPAPPGYSAQSSETTGVNGVSWYQQVEPHAVTWTAIRPGPVAKNQIFVQLDVPTSYSAQAGFLVDLAKPLQTALP